MRHWVSKKLASPAFLVIRRYVEIAAGIAFIAFLSGVVRGLALHPKRFETAQFGFFDYSWLSGIMPIVGPVVADLLELVAEALAAALALAMTVRFVGWLLSAFAARGERGHCA